ncbi:multidrug resistance protein 1A-like [Ostrinia furnacalis]|uniref:multidrug resistance protein 1A-like n=1 Tax=Ostrinia furnacalis TaxID=93504 RepID=UPI00103B4C34|nr:multidrug resistance protein 1A-like [Ostrinia furnacalis]
MSMLKGWKLALLCLTTTPVTFLLVGLTGMIGNRLGKKEAMETGRASAVAEEVLGSIRTVYAFSGQKKELERYRQPLAEARRINIKKEFFTGLSMGLLFFCVFCSYALSFYFGIYLVINDPKNYNADVMFSVFFGIMTALGNFGMVGSLMSTFGSARGAGAQIFRLLDNVPTINPLQQSGITLDQVEGNVELNNVVFHYPSRPEVPVLRGVNLSVSRGQSVALVGHSGCGKSTIIQLISRYYDVIDGSVSIDGNDVRKLSVQWLRRQIGLVGQEPVLFNSTVRENIRYGRESATDDEIEIVARQAYAHAFIMNLPKGYDTLVGERGASLSGGQKQRIAIARALIRNPKILLLDEATSALDTSSEAKVQKALDKAAEGRTTIIVAHRLSTIRNANVIYVMKEGQVVEKGSHEELMAMKGHYSEMVALQERHELGGTEDTLPVREESIISEQSLEDASIPDLLEEDKKAEAPKLSFWRVVRLNAPEWKSITLGSVSSIIIGFSMPLFIVVFGDLFGAMSNPEPSQLMEKVNGVAIVCIIIGIVMGVSNLVESTTFGVAGAYLTERLRVRMFEHMLRQHVAYFDERTNSTGALCARLSGEAAYVQGATGQRIGVCLQGVGSIGLAVVLAMLFEWRVGLVALSFLPIISVVIYYQGKATGEEAIGHVKTLESSTMIAIEAVSNVRTVASLGREQRIISEYVALLQPALAPARRSAHCRGLVAGLSRSMFNFVNAAALTYGGHLIVSDGVACEHILITTQSLQMASGQAQNAFTFAPDFQRGIDAASRIIQFLNTESKIADPAAPAITDFKATGEASFKGVEFKYPTRPNVRVLRGLDLHVERGTTVAIVGRSGCGKSTVVQLLQRFYDPDAGVVALDGVSLPNLRVDEVRASLGLVSQEPVLFDRSIAENIAYGDNSRTPAQHEIVDAAKQANIHSFIVSLPQGYDTNIGSKGTQLSGGQKQRVAIARALIRRPKILLLDEATSALDSESEKIVQEALDAASAGRTCVTIAHRLSTVRRAALVCALARGRVAESGSHARLMARRGLYYSLHAEAQDH